ncbi:MAG: IS1 family transposase ISNisp5 [bacterium]|nr:IS1 family transposase ISNisp5 [bacterium]
MYDLARSAKEFQDKALCNLPCARLQVDEIWSFVGCKQMTKDRGGMGDGGVWTWTALCADTKLVPCWLVGGRDAGYPTEFMQDLAARLTKRVQLTWDGHRAYLDAVEDAFGCEIDYAMLVKLYGADPDNERRYRPATCLGTERGIIMGNPEKEHISTSYVKRQNLTMRMQMRRFTRLTNAFSKKVENRRAVIALHFMHYNFCRIHQTLRVTPAMEAGVTDHVWDLEEILGLMEDSN